MNNKATKALKTTEDEKLVSQPAAYRNINWSKILTHTKKSFKIKSGFTLSTAFKGVTSQDKTQSAIEKEKSSMVVQGTEDGGSGAGRRTTVKGGLYVSQKQIDVTKGGPFEKNATLSNFLSPIFDVNAFVHDDTRSESENSDQNGILSETLGRNKNFIDFVSALKEADVSNDGNKEKRKSFSFLNEKSINLVDGITGVNLGLGVDVGADGKNLVSVDATDL